MPNYEKRFFVYIDACIQDLGAVLCQRSETCDEQVISYASRTCNKHEEKYTAYDLEALALDFALKTWRCYWLGPEFTVYTDNYALTYIRNKKEKPSRIQRMLSRIEEYNFVIQHKPGKNNTVADTLSRNPHNGEINVYNLTYFGEPEISYQKKRT